MGPEVRARITLSAVDQQAAQNAFDTQAGVFGREYARGQSMFSFGRDKVRDAALELRQRIAWLSEVRARRASAGAATNPEFRTQLAENLAAEHFNLEDDVIQVANESNQTTGILSLANRVYQNSDVFRLIGGVALAGAAYSGVIDGQNATTAYEVAAVIGIPGLVDTTRRAFLDTTARYAGLPNRVADLIRRRGVIAEGTATGDHFAFIAPDPAIAVRDELETQAAAQLETQFESSGVNMPPAAVVLPAGMSNRTWAPRNREISQRVMRQFSSIDEMIDSRDRARRSRLGRTAASVLLAVGVTALHLLRPGPQVVEPQPYCGVRTFPVGDPLYGSEIGQGDIHSMLGIAEETWFHRVTGRSFRGEDKDGDLFRKIYAMDREGNGQMITRIEQALLDKNRHFQRVVGRDGIRAGVAIELCPEEVDTALADLPVKPENR